MAGRCAGSRTVATPRTGGGENSKTTRGTLFQLTAVARLGLDRGVFRPAAVAGPALSLAQSDIDTYYFLGFEPGIAPGRLPVVLDARDYRLLAGQSTSEGYLTAVSEARSFTMDTATRPMRS